MSKFVTTPAGVKTRSNTSSTRKTTTQARDSQFEAILRTVAQMQNLKIFTKDEIKNVLSRVADIQLKRFAKSVGVTETSNTGVLPMLQSGRPMASGERHPDFQEWVTAEEIGKLYGLSSEQTAKFTKRYREQFTGEVSANHLAGTRVANFGFPKPDKYGYLTHMNEQGTCVAVWSMRPDGGVNWRNFWSSEAAQKIHHEIQNDGLAALPVSQQNGSQITA